HGRDRGEPATAADEARVGSHDNADSGLDGAGDGLLRDAVPRSALAYTAGGTWAGSGVAIVSSKAGTRS
ncbi:hypothetical protein, partial [Streptomyces sp. NPDC056600]|uniref:hypothetical protein n=1 Tax=Streptomyces sp. NPDC056600 TaxID=3345874 RepID=UPI0036B09F4F